MKVNLRPGKMSDTFSIPVNAQRLVITNWSGTNCKASATFYPAQKEAILLTSPTMALF